MKGVVGRRTKGLPLSKKPQKNSQRDVKGIFKVALAQVTKLQEAQLKLQIELMKARGQGSGSLGEGNEFLFTPVQRD
jgi:hypothetical protein